MKTLKSVVLLLFISILIACGSGGGGGGSDSSSGGGTGESSSSNIKYSGLTSWTKVSPTNAESLCLGTYSGSQTGFNVGMMGTVSNSTAKTKINYPRPLLLVQSLDKSVQNLIKPSLSHNSLTGAIVTESDTIPGDCGGSADVTIELNDVTGSFTATANFKNYCEWEITLSGVVDYTGLIDLNTLEMKSLTATFNDLTVVSPNDSVTASGKIDYSISGSTVTAVLNLEYRDNETFKIYKLENYRIVFISYSNRLEISDINGRYYDPDLGYVNTSTNTPFSIYDDEDYPSSGSMDVTGSNGTYGSNTKARLTALSSSQYECKADADGNGSFEWSSGIKKWDGSPGGDTTAPSIPTGLTATAASSSQINLSWNTSTDNVGVTGYKVYRNGVYLKSVTGTSTSDTGLSSNTPYCYTVRAYDAANNESSHSSQACATTGLGSDTTSPTTPTGLTATAASSSQINLSWNASTDSGGSGLAGYKLYRSGVHIKSVTGTSTSDTGLSANTQYCYTVRAYDAANNESSHSSQACETTDNNVPTTGRVTNSGRHAVEPAWSPDSNKITYNVYDEINGVNRNEWIWIVNLNGGATSKLAISNADHDEYAREPFWGPTGYIVFEAAWGTSAIYKVHSGGGNAVEIVDYGADNGKIKTAGAPVWDLSGSDNVAFIGSDSYSSNVYIIKSNGSNLIKITNYTSYSYIYDVSFSPDGNRLIYSLDNGTSVDIWIVDISTGSKQKLTDTGNNAQGSWSPDGSKIVFSSTRSGNLDLYILTLSDNSIKQITNSNANDADPAWSPDGSKIAFTSDRNGNYEIWVLSGF